MPSFDKVTRADYTTVFDPQEVTTGNSAVAEEVALRSVEVVEVAVAAVSGSVAVVKDREIVVPAVAAAVVGAWEIAARAAVAAAVAAAWEIAAQAPYVSVLEQLGMEG